MNSLKFCVSKISASPFPISSLFFFSHARHGWAWFNLGKGFEIIKKCNQVLRNVKTPEMHVHHGFEGKCRIGKASNKQIVVQTWELEYN